MGQTSEVPKSYHLDEVQYYPLQLYLRNYLAISNIPFRTHVYFCTRLWEKRLKTQEIRFCEFIHCREVLQTSESSLMLEHRRCIIITGMDLVSLLSCYSSIGNCANHDWFQYVVQQLSIDE